MDLRKSRPRDATRGIPRASSTFGSYLRTWREHAGFRSQRAAIRALEGRNVTLSQSLLAHYERGRVRDPAAEKLDALASLYGVGFLEVVLRLARAELESVAGREASGDVERWDLVEAALAPVAHIGSAPDLEAHQLRARAALLREIDVLDVEGLAAWERRFEGLETFWVIASRSFEEEDDRMLRAVVENLKRGVHYTYFTPPNRRVRFEVLREKLQARVGGRPWVATAVQAVWIPPGTLPWLQTDRVVANPTTPSKAVGYQILRREGKTRYALRLPDSDLRDLLDRVTAWRATLERRS
ncbi:MAG: helix-turn-helix domain-containing protein [Planctomycetes bacterium]|nr:helix-turn-helix domain-containing protein [Planctomycetota bacterium]